MLNDEAADFIAGARSKGSWDAFTTPPFAKSTC